MGPNFQVVFNNLKQELSSGGNQVNGKLQQEGWHPAGTAGGCLLLPFDSRTEVPVREHRVGAETEACTGDKLVLWKG